MLVLNAAQTAKALSWPHLIEAIAAIFKSGCDMPARHHHDIAMPGDAAPATLLLMPAWLADRYIGVKQVSVFPDNHRHGLPAIFGSYLLSSGKTGESLAIIEGGELTARRTAAASALAARYLSRDDAEHLLMVGTGRLFLNLIQAHATVRPLRRISIWGRSVEKAEAAAQEARALGFDATACNDLEAAARKADIISCATLSTRPLIQGAWLKPGAHLDLIGAFKPSMRECDDEAMQRAEIYVDTMEGALHEAGDVMQAIESSAISKDDIKGDLAGLVSGEIKGRVKAEQITLFKSVGAACEDLAAAILAYETVTADRGQAKS